MAGEADASRVLGDDSALLHMDVKDVRRNKDLSMNRDTVFHSMLFSLFILVYLERVVYAIDGILLHG